MQRRKDEDASPYQSGKPSWGQTRTLIRATAKSWASNESNTFMPRSQEKTLPPTARFATWNIAWRAWDGPPGREISRRLWGADPEIVRVTEGMIDPPAELGGHWILADSDYGYPHNGRRRKVMLWSRHP